MMQSLELGQDGEEIVDPDYFNDFMNDTIDEKPTKKENIALIKKLNAQKQIDDRKIALVYEALQNGIELVGNKLYYDMLDNYPVFEQKLKKRKSALKPPKSKNQFSAIETSLVDKSAFEMYERLLKQYEDE